MLQLCCITWRWNTNIKVYILILKRKNLRKIWMSSPFRKVYADWFIKKTDVVVHLHVCFKINMWQTNWSLLGAVSEKAMAPHSSTLAWKIPWTEEPGRRQSMGSHRVRHDWANLISLFSFMHWRRKWQPTPVFLLGESQGRGSLVGFRLWGCTEWSDLAAAAA